MKSKLTSALSQLAVRRHAVRRQRGELADKAEEQIERLEGAGRILDERMSQHGRSPWMLHRQREVVAMQREQLEESAGRYTPKGLGHADG